MPEGKKEKIIVVNLKDSKVSEPYDFYIDRRSPVGNPFEMTSEGTRQLVCDQYEDYFIEQLKLNGTQFRQYLDGIRHALNQHGTVRLFCWCAPKRCHGSTIVKWLKGKL